MDIRTEDIQEYVEIMRSRLNKNTPLGRKLVNNFAELEEIERHAIETRATVCQAGGVVPSDKQLDAIEHLTDPNKIKQIMNQQFYNYDVMKAVACSVYSVFYGISEEQQNLGRLFYLKEQVKNLHQIGEESAFGVALTGELKDAKDMFVLKAPRTEDGVADLEHELFIGLFITNQLRKLIPNFAFVYGGLRCAKPQIDEKTKEVISWCDVGESKVPYIIYENITPSESFSEHVKKCSVKQFYSLFMQFILATTVAYDTVGWTHYDSHGGNWLVRKNTVPGLSKTFCIPYSGKTGKVLYVTSESILTAIDYGQSTGKYNGKNHGVGSLNLRAYGLTDGGWPLHDVYKLMMFLASDCANSGNKAVLKELEKLFRFFNKGEGFLQALDAQKPGRDGLYYIFPPLIDTIQYTMGDVLEHCMKVWNLGDVISETPQHDLLECSESCYTFRAVLKNRSDFAAKMEVSTFPEFYDAALYLHRYSLDHYDDLIKNFKYETAKKQFLSQVNGELENLKKYTNSKSVDLRGKKLSTVPVLRQAMENQKNLFHLVSSFENLEILTKIGTSVARVFRDDSLYSDLRKIEKSLVSYEGAMEREINLANENYKYIYSIITKPDWKIFRRTYSWYENSAGDVVALGIRYEKIKRDLFKEIQLPASFVGNDRVITEEVVKKEKPKKVRKEALKGIEVDYVNRAPLAKAGPRVNIQRDKLGNVARLDVL